MTTPPIRRRHTLRRLLGYLRPHRATAAVLTPVLVAATVAELLPPLVIRHIIDDALTPGKGYGRFALLVLALVGTRLLVWCAQLGRGRLAARLGAGVTADLRRDLHDRLTRLPMSFYDHRPAGSLVSHMVKDTETIEQFLAEAVPSLLLNVLLLIGILVFLVVVSSTLTVVVFLPVPFLVTSALLFWGRLRRGWEGQLAAWSRLSARLHESLHGIRVVKTFGAEVGEVARFTRCNEELARAATSADRRSFAFFTNVQLLMGLGLVFVWYIGGRQVLSEDLTLGQLLAVTAYLWMLYWPLQWFGQVNGWVTQALTGAERIFAVLDTPGEDDVEPSAALASPEGRVSFRGVSFGYQPGHPVLRDVDLEIAPGQIVGIVGASGAGKTTLMNLLCRFYDPEDGSICLDGVDVSRLPLAEVRNQIGVVAQEPFLFSGTVADNIGYGRCAASFAEIMQAARVADVHAAVLAQADGYDTGVGEGGRRLSGGQRQRVAIARAVLRDPKILILDEATSSVDPRSERLIQDALHRLAHGRTTFIIAHRPSTLRHVDTVVVLDNGRIVETGPYHRLLARRGHLWNLLHTHADRAPREANSTMEPELDSESRNGEIDLTDPTTMALGAPPLTPQQVRLSRGVTGSLRMDVLNGPSYRHITVVRARPLSDPDHHIVLLHENGDELCLAADLFEFDLASRDIVEEELGRRYLRSVVRRIRSLRTDGDAWHVAAETDHEPHEQRRFVVHHLDESARWLGNGRLLLIDEDGNRYEVARAEALKRLGVPKPLGL